MSDAEERPDVFTWHDRGPYSLVIPYEADPPVITTLGTVMTALDDIQLENSLAGAMSTREAIDLVERNHYRDREIAWASGRWTEALHPRVQNYVPGDVCGLRASAYEASLQTIAQIGERGEEATRDGQYHAGRELGLGAWMYAAVPYFLPVASAVGIAGSHPPDEDMLSELQLPFTRVAVYFAADLTLPSVLRGDDHLLLAIAKQTSDDYREPDGRFRADRFPPRFIHGPQLALAHGGDIRLAGVVFTAKPSGGIEDLVLWLTVTATDAPYPRRVTPGWLSRANARPLALNLAAAVAWGDWHPPPAELDLLGEPLSPEFRKQVRRGAFRRREPSGAAVGVRVLDARRMESRSLSAGGTHASPVTHLRRGHWRRQRVGPRDAWHYERRFIPPVVVNSRRGNGSTLTVYRLPEPPTGRA